MEAEYWQNAWTSGRIGFHQKRVNSRLKKHWPSLEIAPDVPVFVPLCGKTTDMLWLHEQGHPVMGVELSKMAAQAFFLDNDLSFSIRSIKHFDIYCGQDSAAGIEIWVGDFFKLTPDHVAHCGAYFDRAAMIAMNDPLRAEYSTQLARLLKSTCSGLLLVISYDQQRMKGPPFSVTDENVRKLLGPAFDICELEHYSGHGRLGNLADRGLETLEERVYLLNRN